MYVDGPWHVPTYIREFSVKKHTIDGLTDGHVRPLYVFDSASERPLLQARGGMALFPNLFRPSGGRDAGRIYGGMLDPGDVFSLPQAEGELYRTFIIAKFRTSFYDHEDLWGRGAREIHGPRCESTDHCNRNLLVADAARRTGSPSHVMQSVTRGTKVHTLLGV